MADISKPCISDHTCMRFSCKKKRPFMMPHDPKHAISISTMLSSPPYCLPKHVRPYPLPCIMFMSFVHIWLMVHAHRSLSPLKQSLTRKSTRWGRERGWGP